jgi:hypothetical protein
MVSHAGEGAYTVVAVADYLAGAFLCDRKSARNPYQPAAESGDTYGYYYATLFVLRTPGEHPAAMTLLWAKEGGQWKIIAYELTAL